ncbi:MAG: efflux RND transporter periplasmic adaptor subunit [Alteromonas oceani]
MKVFSPVVVLALIALFSGHLKAQSLPSVTVMTAKTEDFTAKVRLPGRIKATTTAEVRPQVTGIISERLFVEGASVEMNQPLYQVEDDTYAAIVSSAQAAVSQAEARLDLAISETARAKKMLSTNTGSKQNYDNTEAERKSAEAALEMARAQLKSAEIDFNRCTIRAPVSGIIGLSQSTPGSLVSAQQANALATIRSIDSVYVDVTQSVNDLLAWYQQPKQYKERMAGNVTLILPTGEVYAQAGELRAAEPRVEPTTGMITLRIAFPNPDYRLIPGLYVEVELPRQQAENAILLPKNVVMRNSSGTASVWIVDDGVVVERTVTMLTGAGNKWVITSGINAGDLVVTSGFQKVAPGVKVEIATPSKG